MLITVEDKGVDAGGSTKKDHEGDEKDEYRRKGVDFHIHKYEY